MKRKRSRNEEHQIPHEILQDILSRLPVQSLVRSKAVDRTCNLLISDPLFSRSHLAHSARQNRTRFMSLHDSSQCNLGYEAARRGEADRRMGMGNDDVAKSESPVFDFLASCHGLLCIINAGDEMFLWNPSTRECKRIPASKIEFPVVSPPCTWASVFFGLGYQSASDDYKVARVSMFHSEDFRTEVKIYSRNSNTWKRINDFPYEFPLARPGMFVGGNLHWMVSMRRNSVRTFMIATLNLEDESYGLMTLPGIRKDVIQFTDIGTLGENLACFSSHCELTTYEYDIWILKEYGKADAWTRVKVVDTCMANIEALVYFQPMCLVGTEAILIRIGPKRFVIYNASHKICWEFSMLGLNKETRMVTFLESLVSPYVR